MIDHNKARTDSGPGCFTSLIMVIGVSMLILMAIINEFRLRRIETKLGLPNCGIFNSATWDGKSCKEAR